METTNQETKELTAAKEVAEKELTAAEKFQQKHGKLSDPAFDFSLLNGVTKEDYKAAVAKANGKKVYHLRVEIDEDEYYDFLAIRPSTSTIRATEAARKLKEGADEKITDLLIKNCLLNPNMDFLDDGTVFVNVLFQLSSFGKDQTNFIMKA